MVILYICSNCLLKMSDIKGSMIALNYDYYNKIIRL